MALRGCCCCGLRGGAKAVGVFFLAVTLIAIVGVYILWAFLVGVPTQSVGIDVDTSEGKFGLQARETHSAFGGTGEDFRVSLAELGTLDTSSGGRVRLSKFRRLQDVLSNGRMSMHSSGRRDSLNVPLIELMPRDCQIELICITVYLMLALIFNSILIRGTDNDSTWAVLSWLAFYGIMFILLTIGSFYGLIYGFPIARTAAGLPILIRAGFGVLASVLLWFWWVLVLIFYLELRNGTRGFRYQRELSLRELSTSHVPGPDGHRKEENWA